MARQSGYQLAEERKRHGMTQAELGMRFAARTSRELTVGLLAAFAC